jgi:hypothetical protein
MIMLLTRNSKIKKSNVRTFNFGIPAFESRTGFKTCPNAAACAEGCYARSGAYRFSNVAQAFERRLTMTMTDDFIDLMNREIKVNRAERIRIHDSGDFYSIDYTMRWFAIMHANPNVEFYAYTKQVSMFKTLEAQGLMPANFRLIYSFGGKEDRLIDVKRDRHSMVFENTEEMLAAGYADANENDDVALDPNPKIGLVYHGTKGYAKTYWSRVPQYLQTVGK